MKNLLIEELSKCNNFNYYIKIGNLKLKVNTKKINHSLIDNSFVFQGGISSICVFDYYSINNKFWLYLNFNNHNIIIQSSLKDDIEFLFKLKDIRINIEKIFTTFSIEECFSLKGKFKHILL